MWNIEVTEALSFPRECQEWKMMMNKCCVALFVKSSLLSVRISLICFLLCVRSSDIFFSWCCWCSHRGFFFVFFIFFSYFPHKENSHHLCSDMRTKFIDKTRWCLSSFPRSEECVCMYVVSRIFFNYVTMSHSVYFDHHANSSLNHLVCHLTIIMNHFSYFRLHHGFMSIRFLFLLMAQPRIYLRNYPPHKSSSFFCFVYLHNLVDTLCDWNLRWFIFHNKMKKLFHQLCFSNFYFSRILIFWLP